MTLTEKYKANYLPGFDCRMTTFRNNLAYYGLNISHGMILGMSGCLSSINYSKVENRFPNFTVKGVMSQTLEELSSVFDTNLTSAKFAKEDRNIWNTIKEMLNNNILVNAAINGKFLQHIRSRNNKEKFVIDSSDSSFHFVTITGLNNNTVTFFETDFGKPLTYDTSTFLELWFFDEINKTHGSNQLERCEGKYYTISAPKQAANSSKVAILLAIKKVTENFFYSKLHLEYGSRGAKKLFEEIVNWKTISDPKGLASSVLFMKILERYFSGGGFGRRLYSLFLNEASIELADVDLKQIAIEFRETSNLWMLFVKEFSSMSVISKITKNDFLLFDQIVDKYSGLLVFAEQQQFINLKDWIQSKC